MFKRIRTGLLFVAFLILVYWSQQTWILRCVLTLAMILALLEIISTPLLRSWAEEQGARLRGIKPGNCFMYQSAILFGAICFMALYRPSFAESLFLLFASFTADIGGYFVGRKIGFHRIRALRNLSPKKTVEGYIGGLLLSWAATGVVVMFYVKFGALEFNLPVQLIWVLGGILAFTGDLLGSATKRELGLKDSSDVVRYVPTLNKIESLLAGHGGALDRFDSFSLVAVAYLAIVQLFGAP